MPPSHSNDRNSETLSPPVSHRERVYPQIVVHGDPCRGYECGLDNYVTSHIHSEQFAPQPSPSKKPPRPLNAYMLFLVDYRRNNAISGKKPTTIEGGKAWRESSDEYKEYYRQLAIEARHQHALQYPEYTLQPKKGRERRPYGSRKRSARQNHRSEGDSVETSSAIEAFINTEFTFSSNSLQPNYPHHPIQEPQPTNTSSLELALSHTQAAEHYSSALGLSHIPHPLSQRPRLSRDTSFSSPSTSFIRHPLPSHVFGFDHSPSTSSNSPSLCYTETPPTPQYLPLSPYAYSSTNQLPSDPANSYLSPHLHFQRLTLNDDSSAYPSTSTSTLPLPPTFLPVTLPQTEVTDQENYLPVPEIFQSQEGSPVVALASPSASISVAHHNDLATSGYWWTANNQPNS